MWHTCSSAPIKRIFGGTAIGSFTQWWQFLFTIIAIATGNLERSHSSLPNFALLDLGTYFLNYSTKFMPQNVAFVHFRYGRYKRGQYYGWLALVIRHIQWSRWRSLPQMVLPVIFRITSSSSTIVGLAVSTSEKNNSQHTSNWKLYNNKLRRCILTKLDMIFGLPSQGFHCLAGVSISSISIVADVRGEGRLRARHVCDRVGYECMYRHW